MRLPESIKPIVPVGTLELQEYIENKYVSNPAPIKCPDPECEAVLTLEDYTIEWPVGKLRFYLGDIPGYRCDSSGTTFVAGIILNKVSAFIQNDLAAMKTEEKFILPNHIRPLPD
ncbi:MAG: hypothetical protein M1142_03185 [Patescibacteria group bacterium]|nr:hypothetical protein [Patescibacteria group bacterium]